MRRRSLPLCLMAVTVLALSAAAAFAEEACSAEETRSEVPALADFHEVIYPLWHEAWPAKNVAMMKELLPRVQEHVKKVQAAQLPGILRERKSAWEEGIKALAATVQQYEKAAAASDEQALLDAVEALHSRYEGLVRIVRPAMKELDAFHVDLYKVYHHLAPAKKIPEILAASESMVKSCATLSVAPVPKRFAAQEDDFRKEGAALCTVTEALRAAASGTDADAVSKAVETVHAQYQKAAKIFE